MHCICVSVILQPEAEVPCLQCWSPSAVQHHHHLLWAAQIIAQALLQDAFHVRQDCLCSPLCPNCILLQRSFQVYDEHWAPLCIIPCPMHLRQHTL